MKGFTLTELLITIAVFVLVLGAVYSGYLLSQRAYQEGEVSAELTQNGRVITERLTREIRQARDIAVELPDTLEEGMSYIEFEDGHIEERYYYIHYFQEGNEVKREVKRYYFSGDDGIFVPWNAIPPDGETLEEIVVESPVAVGELVQDLKFWQAETKTIGAFVLLEKQGKEINFSTKIFGRNL